MPDSSIPSAHLPEITVTGASAQYEVDLTAVGEQDDLVHYTLTLRAGQPVVPGPLTLAWRVPAHGVAGVWTTDALHEKRLRADWEHAPVRAHSAANAPVVCLFGHGDANVQTFACSDAVHTTTLQAVVREEDSFIYCQLTFFVECLAPITAYDAVLRIDGRAVSFDEALQDVASWWAASETLQPRAVPDAAREPVYSTWYAYHQTLSVETLLAECRAAVAMGYTTLIVDDGWQTLDSNRGYDFTGDWQPERIPDMAGFVRRVHDAGMRCMLWYSVPFVGKHAEAYTRFQGKFLTHTHRWAFVLDPRFPDVRAYLVETYAAALKAWDLDGFKLDFIDDFTLYPDTERSDADGRDYACVNEAVDRLLADVVQALTAIKPDLMIEFRQRYTGPAMRKYGTLFRAFDCPNDAVTNRVRTTDVKLLCGTTAVHADMVTWHYDEPVDLAALQLWNVLFAVPQLSVRLAEVPASHRQMIAAFTRYWLANRDLLLRGRFSARQPLANYPILQAHNEAKLIVGLYQNAVYSLSTAFAAIDVINATRTRRVVLDVQADLGSYEAHIFDCLGGQVERAARALHRGLHMFYVPPSGRVELRALTNH